MLDYGSLLDRSTKRSVLIQKLENQEQYIKHHIVDTDDADTISFMEDLVTTLDDFLKRNIPSTPQD